MSKNKQNKPSMEEAIGNRATEEEKITKQLLEQQDKTQMETPPQVQNELIQQAMRDAHHDGIPMGNTQPPQVPTPEKKEEEPKTITPVSNTNLQPTIATSSPESQADVDTRSFNKWRYGNGKDILIEEQDAPLLIDENKIPMKQDENLRRLKEYVFEESYSPTWVQLHITSISSYPRVCPSPTLWDTKGMEDIAKMVHTVVRTPGYVEASWPHLKCIMNDSRDNVEWAVSVLTTIALFDTIKLIPYMEK